MRNKVQLLVYSSFFIFLLLLVSTSPVSAEEVVIKQVTDFDLKRPCFNNGTFCSAAATCNITITQPDGVGLVSGAAMTYQGTFFNYTLLKSQTTNVGFHPSIMSCTDGGVSGQDTFSILVSPSGTDDNSIQNIILLSFAALLSVGVIAFGFNKQDPILVMLGGMVLFLFGLYTLLNGVGNYRNDLTEWTSLIVLGIAGYVSARTGLEMMDVL